MRAAHLRSLFTSLRQTAIDEVSTEAQKGYHVHRTASTFFQQASYCSAAKSQSSETKQTNLCSAINDALHIALEQDTRCGKSSRSPLRALMLGGCLVSKQQGQRLGGTL